MANLKPGQTPKGRPTPKRSEAERARRQSLAAPKSSKEARRRARDRARQQRLEQRQALLTGDSAKLPPRDAGPVRKFVRDYVDARLCAAEFFLVIAAVMIVMLFIPNPAVYNLMSLIYLAGLVIIIGDSIWLGFGLRRELRRRFPDKEHRRGAVAYGLMRSMQMRRLRLPRPQVERGQRI